MFMLSFRVVTSSQATTRSVRPTWTLARCCSSTGRGGVSGTSTSPSITSESTSEKRSASISRGSVSEERGAAVVNPPGGQVVAKMITLFWKIVTVFWKMRKLFWKITILVWKMTTLFWKLLTPFRNMIPLFWKTIVWFFNDDIILENDNTVLENDTTIFTFFLLLQLDSPGSAHDRHCYIINL